MIQEAIIEHPFLSKLSTDKSPLNPNLVERALDVIHRTTVPTTRVEAWKYTRLAKITKQSYGVLDQSVSTIDAYSIDVNAVNIVFVNGYFQKSLSSTSLPIGLKIKSLTELTSDELEQVGKNVVLENELFNAINTVYSQDGIYIEIEKGQKIEQSIQLIHISTGSEVISNQRNVIVARESSEAHIIQSYFTENAAHTFVNHITEIFVDSNANLTIDKLQAEGENNHQIITEQVEQAKDSTFTINTLTLNGGVVRNNLTIAVNGQNCETNLNGAYLLKGNQHVDNHTVVDHLKANCNSNELYKGVIDEKATAVFNGKVFVRKDSQKINAFQSNGNVLLTDDATVNSKPELEIYADDVKCSHGSTTGQLDEESIFYLRARGLSERAARQLMVSAFVGDVFEKVENEHVMKFVHAVLEKRFGWIN